MEAHLGNFYVTGKVLAAGINKVEKTKSLPSKSSRCEEDI